MPNDRLWSKPNTIAPPPGPFAPILVLRNAVNEVPHRVEHRAPHEHRCGDRELELLDVALVAKGKHALKRLGRRHPLRILNQHVDAPAGDIRVAQFGEAFLEPPLIRPTVAVDESERL